MLTDQKPLIEEVLRDLESSSLAPSRKALLRYVEKVSLRTAPVTEEDFAALRAHGWSDSAIYDAVTVTALFAFFNRWVDGCGVADMSPEGYAQGAQFIKKGYR